MIEYFITNYFYGLTIQRALISLLVVLLFTYLFYRIINKKVNILKWLTLSMYIWGLLCITLLGRTAHIVSSSFDTIFMTYKLLYNNFHLYYVLEILLNMLLFMPLGFLLYYEFKNVSQTIFICILSSLTIEFIQLLTETGIFEICDLIDNTIGAIIGIVICKLILMRRKKVC